jgi:serine/threonine protein phosphatase PrpC
LVVIFVGTSIYVANCGSSRAVISLKQGKHDVKLARAHTTANSNEMRRLKRDGCGLTTKGHPIRILESGRSETRTIGNAFARSSSVICEPEISKLTLTSEFDCIILTTGGIELDNAEVVKAAWKGGPNLGSAAEKVITNGRVHDSSETAAAVVIGLSGLVRNRR